MSCNYCGESYGVKMYYCKECDNNICEYCTDDKKDFCNDIDCKGTKCIYTNICEIYNLND